MSYCQDGQPIQNALIQQPTRFEVKSNADPVSLRDVLVPITAPTKSVPSQNFYKFLEKKNNEPEWKLEKKRSLESLHKLFMKSFQEAEQVIAFSLNEKQAEQVVEKFVKQITTDFTLVSEKIENMKLRKNLCGPSGFTSLLGNALTVENQNTLLQIPCYKTYLEEFHEAPNIEAIDEAISEHSVLKETRSAKAEKKTEDKEIREVKRR